MFQNAIFCSVFSFELLKIRLYPAQGYLDRKRILLSRLNSLSNINISRRFRSALRAKMSFNPWDLNPEKLNFLILLLTAFLDFSVGRKTVKLFINRLYFIIYSLISSWHFFLISYFIGNFLDLFEKCTLDCAFFIT